MRSTTQEAGKHMGLFSRATPKRATTFDTELLPGETTIYVSGVSYRQSEIKKLGTGAHIFALVAEPTNSVDANAVMVMGMKSGGAIHVGYLPAGAHSTLALRELALMTAPSGKLPAVNGIVKKDNTGYLVDLRAPHSATTKKLVRAAS